MSARLIRSVFTTLVLAHALAGCTDLCSGIAGDQCSDSSDTGGSSGPKYHTFYDPHPLHVAGEDFVIMASHDDGTPGTYEELALPLASDDTAVWRATEIPTGGWPDFACGRDTCIGAWRTGTGFTFSIRASGTWSGWHSLDADASELAVAALDDGFLIATGGDEDSGGQQMRVEVIRVGKLGETLGRWTLAKDATAGFLALAGANTPTSIGVVAWQRQDAAGAHAVAQILDEKGAPSGVPLELPLAYLTSRVGSLPAVFSSGAYHVAHNGVDGAPWFVVDPIARTIEARPLPIAGDIQQAVAVPQGIAVISTMQGTHLSLVQNETITHRLDLPFDEKIAATTDGALLLAHHEDGSVFGSAVPSSYDRATRTTVLAETYEIGGCSAGGSASLLLPMMCLFGLRRRRRK